MVHMECWAFLMMTTGLCPYPSKMRKDRFFGGGKPRRERITGSATTVAWGFSS